MSSAALALFERNGRTVFDSPLSFPLAHQMAPPKELHCESEHGVVVGLKLSKAKQLSRSISLRVRSPWDEIMIMYVPSPYFDVLPCLRGLINLTNRKYREIHRYMQAPQLRLMALGGLGCDHSTRSCAQVELAHRNLKR